MNPRERGKTQNFHLRSIYPQEEWSGRDECHSAVVSDGEIVPGGRVAVSCFRLHRWNRDFNNYWLTAAVVLIP